jgi:hypothetical protein
VAEYEEKEKQRFLHRHAVPTAPKAAASVRVACCLLLVASAERHASGDAGAVASPMQDRGPIVLAVWCCGSSRSRLPLNVDALGPFLLISPGSCPSWVGLWRATMSASLLKLPQCLFCSSFCLHGATQTAGGILAVRLIQASHCNGVAGRDLQSPKGLLARAHTRSRCAFCLSTESCVGAELPLAVPVSAEAAEPMLAPRNRRATSVTPVEISPAQSRALAVHQMQLPPWTGATCLRTLPLAVHDKTFLRTSAFRQDGRAGD